MSHFPQDELRIISRVLVAVLLLALAATGCGGGGETTVTVERTVTVSASVAVSPPAEREAYITQIDDIASQADQINRDYRDAIDRYNRQEATTTELSDRAGINWRSFEDFSRRLTEMKVPPEFQEAHKQLISGFNKWQSAYQAYRDGFRDNNNTLLEQARSLDSQAVIEVNQAINEISQPVEQ